MVQANHTSMQKNSLSRQSPYLVRIDPIHAVMEPVLPFVALGAAYATELLGDSLEAFAQRRRPRFQGSAVDVIKFLLPAHITGLATGMLLYACDALYPIAFAASIGL